MRGKKYMFTEIPLTIFLTLVPRVEKSPLPQGARCKHLFSFALYHFEHCFLRIFNALALTSNDSLIDNMNFPCFNVQIGGDLKIMHILNNYIEQNQSYRVGFTLGETLLTLGIVGVLAAILIPPLNNEIQDIEYKTAYKKAYSDASNVWRSMMNENVVEARTGQYEATIPFTNFNTFMSYFTVSKTCMGAQVGKCWNLNGEQLYDAKPSGDAIGGSFIDNSGRAWLYIPADFSGDNIYVDINGFPPPNKYGKDSFGFYPLTESGSLGAGLPVKLMPRSDCTVYNYAICHFPPCYFNSWLFK